MSKSTFIFFCYALRSANIMLFSRRRSVGMNHFCRLDPVHRLALPLGHLHCTSGRYEVLSLHPECLLVLTSFRLAVQITEGERQSVYRVRMTEVIHPDGPMARERYDVSGT